MSFLGSCNSCGSELVKMKWNSSTDVIVCDNINCGAFRNPIIPEEIQYEKGEQTKIKKKMRRLWGILHTEE